MGDIAKATGHLTQGEMGAYDLLLDWVYSNEKPLPLDLKLVARIGLGYSRVEYLNVTNVLRQFFDKTEVGYTQKRVLQEIAKANAQAENNRAIAFEREEKKRVRKDHESCNESLNVSSTNRQPSQTPDSRQEQKISTTNVVDGDFSPKIPRSVVPFEKIVDLYHQQLPTLPHVEKLTDKRKGYMRQRWSEDLPSLEAWGRYFEDVARSKFLMGKAQGINGKPPFIANLEWLCNPSNFVKVAEGNYNR